MGKKFDVDMLYLISNCYKADALRSQPQAEDLTVDSVSAKSRRLGDFTLSPCLRQTAVCKSVPGTLPVYSHGPLGRAK